VSDGPRRNQRSASLARRAADWLAWWVLLMSFWVVLDYSIAVDELVAGAGAAALGAFLAEFAAYQASARFTMRVRWVLAALWRRLARGADPPSGFRELPVRYGSDTPEGVTRRVLLIGGRSLAPNTFVLGMDPGRNVVVIHQLAAHEGEVTD
jgi:multisubunit Na+/H+ antiporter MnhE subunit